MNVDNSGANSRGGWTNINGLLTSLRGQIAALAPMINTPEGHMQLLTLLKQYLDNGGDVLQLSDGYSRQQAADLQQLIAELGKGPQSSQVSARMRDMVTATDPNADPTTRRLAQERLHDLQYSNFMGPLTVDPITGADARQRAAARVQFQQFLESGQAFGGSTPLTPDQATQLLDNWEANGREMILGNFADRLRRAGVSEPGIQRAVGEIRSGTSPAELWRDVGDGLSWYGSALGGGAEAHGGAIPNGRHWAPDVPRWSESDAKALEAFGRKLTVAGVGLDAIITSYDIANGAPAGPAVAELGGRTVGGILGGMAAGAAWGSLVGPEGTLIVGLLGGIAGATLGEDAVKAALGE